MTWYNVINKFDYVYFFYWGLGGFTSANLCFRIIMICMRNFFFAQIVCIFDSIKIYVLQLHTYIVIEKINKLHTQKTSSNHYNSI